MTYSFDVDKISDYLIKYRNSLSELYSWNVSLKGLVSLGVITDNDFDKFENSGAYEKEIFVKKVVSKALNSRYESYDEDRKKFDDLCLWIVKDWGGIGGSSESSTLELVHDYLESGNTKFNRVASYSKVASFMFPRKCVIYDSRVAYSLNWILLSENAGTHFFPVPEGRNSKMSAFDINVLIHLKHIGLYVPERDSDLNNRLYINKIDKSLYVNKDIAYSQLNSLIKDISNKLWIGDKAEMLYYTEMLLFSIADKGVFGDIARRVKIYIT